MALQEHTARGRAGACARPTLWHDTQSSFVKYRLDSQEDTLELVNRPGSAGWGHDDLASYARMTAEDGVSCVVETIPAPANHLPRGVRGHRARQLRAREGGRRWR